MNIQTMMEKKTRAATLYDWYARIQYSTGRVQTKSRIRVLGCPVLTLRGNEENADHDGEEGQDGKRHGRGQVAVVEGDVDREREERREGGH